MSAENSINVSGEGNLAQSSSPTKSRSSARRIIDVLDNRVLIFDPAERGSKAVQSGSRFFQRQYKDQRYAFDQIHGEQASQDDVFNTTTRPLLDGVLHGFNATVFAYGATGCGKTYTISGTAESPGLVFLTMADLFKRIQDYGDEKDVKVSLSYLEIYNECIRDLLTEDPPPRGGLALREDANNRMTIPNLSEHHPKSPDEVISMILAGNTRRTQSPTMANATSSRSHAVLQINVRQKERLEDDITIATLSIIDLAGSERASATQNSGVRLHEGANINKSLLALGNCINALCEGKKQHVPYRNSKLTRLLKFSLGGNCKTVMIVCVSPFSLHYEETSNTLKYANRAKEIKTKVSRNTLSADNHVREYVLKIAELQAANKDLRMQLSSSRGSDNALTTRKRQQAELELDRAIGDLRAKFDSSKAALSEKGNCEASLASAQSYLNAVKAKVNEQRPPFDSSPEISSREQELLQGLTSMERFIVAPGSAISKRLEIVTQTASILDNALSAARDRKFEDVDDQGIQKYHIMSNNWQLQSQVDHLSAREIVWKQSLCEAHAKAVLFAAHLARNIVSIERLAQQLQTDPAVGMSVVAELTQTAESSLAGFRNSNPAPTHSIQMPTSTHAHLGVSPIKSRSLYPIRAINISPKKAVRLASPRKLQASLRQRSLLSSNATNGVGRPGKSLRWRDQQGDAELCDSKVMSDHQNTSSDRSVFAGESPDVTTNGTNMAGKASHADPDKAADSEWVDEATDTVSGLHRHTPRKQAMTMPRLARRSLATQPLALRKMTKTSDNPFADTDLSGYIPNNERQPFADVRNVPSYAAPTVASRQSARPSLSLDNKFMLNTNGLSSSIGPVRPDHYKPRLSLMPMSGSGIKHSPLRASVAAFGSSLSGSKNGRSPNQQRRQRLSLIGGDIRSTMSARSSINIDKAPLMTSTGSQRWR